MVYYGGGVGDSTYMYNIKSLQRTDMHFDKLKPCPSSIRLDQGLKA